jgi:DNA-binding transcriptional LysR family regulator
MRDKFPSLTTDQVAAFVELAFQGSLRAAAEKLHITEQGLRNRLLSLEQRLQVQLYRKQRGIRRDMPLTAHGKLFLPHARAFLERARDLTELFGAEREPREVHVVASQYLILYVLIDAVRRFHAAYPGIQVRLTTRIEDEVGLTLLKEPEVALGVAAPYEMLPELEYRHLFSMNWSLITPPGHPLLRVKRLSLAKLAKQPLIFFERGSTGRQHVMDAFHEQDLSPHIDMEVTNTEIIIRMVEAGLGVSIVPLLDSGVVTRGRKIGIRSLGGAIRPILSGILTRRGENLAAAGRAFLNFVHPEAPF